MSRNSRSEQRKTELIKQQSFIEQKNILISKKIQAKELLEKYKSQTNRSELLPNDGSFLENFKRLTGSSSSSTNEISASSSSSHTVPLQLNAIPSLSHLEFEQKHHNNHQQPQQQQQIELNDIPTPREIDLSLIPKPSSFKLDEICMPPLIEGSKIKVPKSRAELIELVSANGDGYEENLVIKCNKDELDPLLRFIFDKNCTEYLEYRREVMERRRGDKYDPLDELQYEDYKKAPSMMLQGPKTFGFHYSQQTTQEKVAKTVTTIRNDDSESTNSDTETWNSMKERNLKNLKRKAIHSRSRKQQDASTTDSSDDNTESKDDPRYDSKYKMSSAASTSSSNSKKSGDQCEQNHLEKQQQQQLDQSNANSDKTSESSSRPPKRKKSRWSEGPATIQTVVVPPPVTSSSILPPVPTSILKLATVTRSDPALLNYARQNFGTTSLTEEDWKKAEEHYKVNLLFQDMQRKRQEIDQLAKNGKFKYEYDSDEDVNGGTWEHKMRTQEMEATLKWAEALNKQCQGRHHIGDFLPPEELKKFMEKYQAQKDPSRLPDVSDYKEFKLKEDNIGYQMLQKLGWKGEGTSLGVSGSGITEPINKAAPRENLQGLGANEVEAPNENDNEYEIYRKRMMLAYRFRPNPLNNPRRAYY
ncbi:unnamed protein product [Chironomus riparius]|uniref:G-patch domain-containing protein n=1 Tax=Chironomus riparius TaxID=315576 RepID=A0A9N9S441_9DIPT|nr:unnamed protein product [Chironomus riparius]